MCVWVCVLFLSALVFVHRPSHLFHRHICDLQGGDWYGNIITQARISSFPFANLSAHLSPSPHLSLSLPSQNGSALSPLLLRVIHLNSRGPGGSQLTCRDLNGAWATVNQPVLERGHGAARGMSKTCVCVWARVRASVRGSGCVTHRFSRLSSRSDGSVRALLEKWKSALLFSDRLRYIIAFRKGFICQTGWDMQKYSACVSFSCDQCEWLLHTFLRFA